MSQFKDLKAATTLAHVANLLGVKPGLLSFELYIKEKDDLYTKFDIPKKYGGIREIWAPNRGLKLIQHRLANLLQNCVSEIEASHGHFGSDQQIGISHGFKRGHTIMTNARAHVTRRYVFNVDLHDFFGTINFGRVRGFFLKDRNFALHPAVATVLAQIACHQNRLPQGSPCSPVIANLIGHTLDILLARLAARTSCTYTRYADDLTFSTNKSSFPLEIAKQDDTDQHNWTPGQDLTHLVRKSGFSFNEKKTRMQYRDSRQEVTGLVVNRKINVPTSYRRTVRAMVDSLLKTGDFYFIYEKLDTRGISIITKHLGHRNELLGMLSYIDNVDLFNKQLCEKNHRPPHQTPGRIELFRQFLYFDAFYAPSMPVIVCEGKTDNTYIKCAIKSLAPSYPMLAVPTTPSSLSVRLFKYAEQRTSEITEIKGGVTNLKKLIQYYYSYFTEKFKAPLPNHPVIILIDNDSGANIIYDTIAGITKKKRPAKSEAFIHVIGNLYVVPTPLSASEEPTMIEDFFDQATLNLSLNGKNFNPNKDADNTIHFGKSAFARDIVEKNAGTIKFDGFSVILDRISLVITEYTKTHPNFI